MSIATFELIRDIVTWFAGFGAVGFLLMMLSVLGCQTGDADSKPTEIIALVGVGLFGLEIGIWLLSLITLAIGYGVQWLFHLSFIPI